MKNQVEGIPENINLENPSSDYLDLSTYRGSSLVFSINRFIKFLCSISIVFILLSLAGQFYRYFYNAGEERYITHMFNLDEEINFPTFFSSFLLLFSSSLFLLIAATKKKFHEKYYLNWYFLSGILFLMSMDEILMIHEQFSTPIRNSLHTQGFLYFAWLLPALGFILIFLVVNINLFISLSERYQKGLFLAAFIYLNGAFIMEMIGGKFLSFYGQINFSYALLTTFEESLELIGLILLIYNLLMYIKNELPNLSLKLE